MHEENNTYEGDGAEKIGLEAALPVIGIVVCNPIDRPQGTVVEHHAIKLAPFRHG